MGSKTKQVKTPTELSPEGQEQFDFAAGQLQQRFGQDVSQIGFNRGGIDRISGKLENFKPGENTNRALGTLENFTGTNQAKSDIKELGNFRGSGDAFRTLRSLEGFGQDQANFDSEASDLLLNTARGDFLTQQSGNPFIADVIDSAQRGSIRNFNESVLPNLTASFSGTGGVGSTLQAAFAAQQARDLQTNLGDISSDISFNVFEAERQRQQAAQDSLLGFDNQSLDRLLQSRITAGQQATDLSAQELAALQGQAQGSTQLSGQAGQALADATQGRISVEQIKAGTLQSALQGQTSAADLDFRTQAANAQLENDRIQQLLDAQRSARSGGDTQVQTITKPRILPF